MSGALEKIPLPRLVWLEIENTLPRPVSQPLKIHPRQDIFFIIIFYLVWGISKNLPCQTSLANNKRYSLTD